MEMIKPVTAGELRAALADVPDDAEVWVMPWDSAGDPHVSGTVCLMFDDDFDVVRTVIA